MTLLRQLCGAHRKVYISPHLWELSLVSIPVVHIILGSHRWCSMVIVGKLYGAVLVSLGPLAFIWNLTVEVLNCRCSAVLLFHMLPLKGMCVALVDQ